MLPDSTPCDAIVYGAGYVPLRKMMGYGLVMYLAGAAIVAAVHLLTPLIQ